MTIKISGVALPSPDHYAVSYEEIGEFDRNANGNLVGDLVAVKTVINVRWNFLENADFGLLLGHVRPIFVEVEFYCPRLGAARELVMRAMADGGKIAWAGGGVWWKDVGCVLFER